MTKVCSIKINKVILRKMGTYFQVENFEGVQMFFNLYLHHRFDAHAMFESET